VLFFSFFLRAPLGSISCVIGPGQIAGPFFFFFLKFFFFSPLLTSAISDRVANFLFWTSVRRDYTSRVLQNHNLSPEGRAQHRSPKHSAQ
jgi:hypothetical protein